MGSKVLERNVFVSNSEIKAEKEQPDHEVQILILYLVYLVIQDDKKGREQ